MRFYICLRCSEHEEITEGLGVFSWGVFWSDLSSQLWAYLLHGEFHAERKRLEFIRMFVFPVRGCVFLPGMLTLGF